MVKITRKAERTEKYIPGKAKVEDIVVFEKLNANVVSKTYNYSTSKEGIEISQKTNLVIRYRENNIKKNDIVENLETGDKYKVYQVNVNKLTTICPLVLINDRA